MNDHKDCKGCRMGEKCGYGSCAYRKADIAEFCPCLLCLTKVICNKEDCEKRMDLYHEEQNQRGKRK